MKIYIKQIKISLLTAFMFVSGMTFASNWIEIDRFEDGMRVYADSSRIKEVSSHIVRLEHLVRWPEPQTDPDHPPYQSTLVSSDYDCDQKAEKYLASTSYSDTMGKGKKIISDTNEADEWAPISEDSLEEKLWKMACKK